MQYRCRCRSGTIDALHIVHTGYADPDAEVCVAKMKITKRRFVFTMEIAALPQARLFATFPQDSPKVPPRFPRGSRRAPHGSPVFPHTGHFVRVVLVVMLCPSVENCLPKPDCGIPAYIAHYGETGDVLPVA